MKLGFLERNLYFISKYISIHNYPYQKAFNERLFLNLIQAKGISSLLCLPPRTPTLIHHLPLPKKST